MKRQIVGSALVFVLCLTAPFAYGQRGKSAEKGEKGGESRAKGGEKPGGEKQEKGAEPRAKGGEKPGQEIKPGNKPPGGAWSEGKQSSNMPGEGKNKSTEATGAEGAAAEHAAGKNKSQQATGAEGAAAGAAASNRNKPATSGAEGAAAGAAAVNRNKPAASGAQGAAVGAAAVNRNQPAASGAVGAAAGYTAVRNSFDHPSLYNQQWYANNPGVWTANNFTAGAVWTATSLAAVSTLCGYSNNRPISYGYGNNVVYQNGNVILDGKNVGTAEEYSQQAADLAWIGQSATTQDDDEWLPLGVFALVRNTDQQPHLTLQMAINKEGILRGNYTDLVSDHTLAIHGAVEKETQRAAWTIDNKKNFFMEAGLSNLTSGEAPVLIHKSGRTEKWLLVRLPKPESADVAAADPN